jgi:hypothetical protein
MTLPDVATLAHFQQEVAELLELPPGSGDTEVRNALRAKGADFEAWYDMRLEAILESRQPLHHRQRIHQSARRVDRRH